MADDETKGFNRSKQIAQEENEADKKIVPKLIRKAAGAAFAVPAGLAGAAVLGPQPDSPGYIDSGKFGAKSAYYTVTGDKKGLKQAEDDYLAAKKETAENKKAKGGPIKKMARGGGIESRGKTKGRFV